MRHVILIIIVLFALTLPYTKLQYYYLIILPFIILSFIVAAPLNKKQRLILGLVLIGIYYRTLYIILNIFYLFYNIYTKFPSENREDDKIVQSKVNFFLNKHFIYKNNFHNIPAQPTIFVANYVLDRIENITCITLPVPLCVVMGSGFITNFKLNKIVKHVHGKYKNDGEYDQVKDALSEKLKKGISIFSYSSRPFIKDRIGRVRSGMFRIAKDLNRTITPVYFDHIEHNHGVILPQRYTIVVGDTFEVKDIETSVYNTKKFFKDTRKKLKLRKFIL